MPEPNGSLLMIASMRLLSDIDEARILARHEPPVKWCPVPFRLCFDIKAAHWLALAYGHVAGHSLQPTRARIMMPHGM